MQLICTNDFDMLLSESGASDNAMRIDKRIDNIDNGIGIA